MTDHHSKAERKRWRETERIKYPWAKSFYSARQRCANPNDLKYMRYGGRGIKFFLTREDMTFLWARDNASSLKQPTIDRIDIDGNYEASNCRFIERSENARLGNLGRRKTHCKRGHVLSKENFWVHGGKRVCKLCHKLRVAKLKSKKGGEK